MMFIDASCVKVFKKIYITKSQENCVPWSFQFLQQIKSSTLRTGPKQSSEIHNISKEIGKYEINREKAQKVQWL